ncbi:hypothetical protein QTJ16_006844 [Diplocarpon rosae]|uniref:Nuclear condensin complex subunit 3 C-terminal domain-containing protein n=1 Tax=Diplocarpon rosae TaxID=946125 RepID=A0AAD9SS42_9HELO|nr:hypothetical protein QTJ16_006844 [Diplocarpon rosae]PBP26775.1 ARM repeat-containing protein [Diplocarpon rosae]
MPSRVSSARTTRASGVSHKSSVQTLNSRASTASRISTPNVEIPEEGPENELRTQVSSIFRDAQRTTASHRKLVINLRKFQEACCYEPTSCRTKKTGAEDFDEDQFTNEFTRCVLRIMPVKKSESVGERAIRFTGLFLRHAIEKDNELAQDGDDDDAGVLVETPSTRLTSNLMNAVLPLLTSKEKFVRYRSTQLISHIINSLEAIDDDLFQLLRHGLLKRIHDKEAMVRVQAVLGLGRLAGNEVEGEAADSDDEESGSGLLERLLDVLQNDPSADVRRSLLVNLPILPNTLPFLLERARDQDPATRRALYSRLLPALGDFRHLSLSMREKLLRWGLRDRDENVRKAAGKLFRERWIEDCAGATELGEREGAEATNREAKPPNFDGLLELLERIDVVNSGVENGVALEAMKGFWEGRPDYRDEVTFDDFFWDTLSAEAVFMARSFNDFCRYGGNGKLEALIEDKMPEVTKLAFYLQRYITVLVDALKRVSEQEPGEEDEEGDTVEQEFIVEQLLHIARTLDYSDEVGRRKMFALLRQSLSIPDLPEEVTKLTVEVLRGICAGDAAGEREFCSVVLEAVADVHDTIMDEPTSDDADESFHSAKSEISGEGTPTKSGKVSQETEEEDQDKAIREIMVNMKCLHIVQCMLENVEGNLQQNVDLVAMLNNLVVPAVRSHEAPVRERGLLCLGLCSLLDKSLAEENLTLFMHFFNKGHATLQITALQILTDILIEHGAHLLDTNPTLLKVYLKALKSGNKTPEVQGAATVAVAKLMLGRVISDASPAIDDLLKTLVVLYFDPSTAHNQGVRQALSYFLPVYSFSRRENQERMRKVAPDALHKLFEVQETLDDEGDAETEMVSLGTIGAHLIDWTDPRKCYTSGGQITLDESAKKAVNGDVHLEFARDLLERLGSSASREEKKTLAPLLAKLHISPASTPSLLREIYAQVSLAIDEKLITDATGRNALFKLHVSLGKIVNNLKETDDETVSLTLNLKGSVNSNGGVSCKSSVTPSLVEEKSVLDTVEGGEEEELDAVEEDDDEGTIIGNPTPRTSSQRDSILEELLSDGDADISGV